MLDRLRPLRDGIFRIGIKPSDRPDERGGFVNSSAIHATETVGAALHGQYLFEERGTIDAKGLGEMRTYFLLGRQA